MGFNNENLSGSDLRWMAFDLETAGREDARPFLPEPIADKRLTDPVKVAADLERKRTENASKLSLDPNGCRIVALGWQTETGDEPTVLSVPADERFMVKTFWQEMTGRLLVGFCSRIFDLPVIIQRSRFLGVSVPRHWRDLIAPYGRARQHLDLFDEWTLDNTRQDGVIPRRLAVVCQLLGLDVPHDDIEGSDIAALVAAGDWEAVRQHCSADVARTVALGRRLAVLPSRMVA